MPVSYSVGPSDGPVLVTGATGYVAGRVVQSLLDAGVTVHACVRDPSNTEKVAHLYRAAEASPGNIRLFKADLLSPGSHDAPMRDCRYVMHTASPFVAGKISDPVAGFVRPALNGTRDILEAANRTGSVERVVLTSSTVAVDDMLAPPGRRDEASWNESATLENHPYAYSKVLAEREAWKIAGSQSRWKLVVINPAFVIGPGAGATSTSGSFTIIKGLASGVYSKGLPPAEVGVVDVEDVAEAHLRGAFIKEAEGRHIILGEARGFDEMGRWLKEEFGGDASNYPPDTPRPTQWRDCPLDNSKSKAALGMQYRPVKPALIAMYRQIRES
jgi:nucleoside-diphosphate-sugar epimerase